MGESEQKLSEARERAVRAELNRLLGSGAFRTSKRCSEFLKHIVEHTIAGQTDSLKERSIGMDLFQLPPDFDTGQHTIVRVTANEVRKKLAQHYQAENHSNHPVRIHLPPGSYSAEFRWEAPAVEANVPARRRRLVLPLLIFVTAVLLVGTAYLLWRSNDLKPVSRDTASTPVSRDTTSTPGSGRASGAPASADLRMIAGAINPYVDRSGRAWGADRFFSGGSLPSLPSTERVFRTLDPDIYRHGRQGDFRYDIPLAPGAYEMHLHFAETGLADFISAESSGEGQRLFRIFANGKQILDLFDVVADAAGANTADERVFRDIAPAKDGFLHLSFASQRGAAILNGIEVLPVSPGKVRPIRIRAGWPSSWRDSAGQEWRADSYFLGGNALVRSKNPARASEPGSPDLTLYASERWGNFSYAVPVAEGSYRVTLKFCEGHYGPGNTGVGGLGSRVFDVYCNGTALVRNFDIFKEAGREGRPLDRTFSGIRPTAQGKIVLSFVPVVKMACVNGIEVVEESE